MKHDRSGRSCCVRLAGQPGKAFEEQVCEQTDETGREPHKYPGEDHSKLK